ncbi:MAG: hypothetical protein E7630_00915 [Ruminococcaceae bacterium]|nr:hypothetical protein [Oscillospiraceae bacterium]
MSAVVLPVIAFLLTLVATVLAFIFIIPEKKRARLNKFGKFLHDTFNFKYLVIEKILQALYVFATIFIVALGFCMLFYVQRGFFGGSTWFGGYGILLMLFGPIGIRLAYEFIMMFLILIKNVTQINNKLECPDETKKKKEKKPAAVNAAPAAPVEQQPAPFCPTCGAKVESGGFCPNCGTKL